jgi:hypothetical protein
MAPRPTGGALAGRSELRVFDNGTASQGQFVRELSLRVLGDRRHR